jgi:hypothetical protein
MRFLGLGGDEHTPRLIAMFLWTCITRREHYTGSFFFHTGKTEFHYQGNEITKDTVQNHSTTHKKLRNHPDI